MNDDKYYSRARPVDVRFHGVCYYCGCEAESKFEDFIPQKIDIEFYLQTKEACPFAIVQCCKECHYFLMNCRSAVIKDRKKYINKSIKRKYGRALNIYERWSEDEFEDLSDSIIKSIIAGMKIGKESDDRIQFSGYEYEIDGTIHHKNEIEVKIYQVFGEEFDDFRKALQYASKSYRINITVLKQRLIDNQIDFDKAIKTYHAELEQKLLEKQIDKLSKEFALKHKQNKNFVKSALSAYIQINPLLSMPQNLDLIYQERIKKLTTTESKIIKPS
ncbi:MAG: hypothetical protein HRU38_12250 [Saccharospirillaceae bacterium]|nr:hypothetical protein [Pseudomonadales bacterium]NRB79419.1 hypothetical protein [Saccharospirillaceae bacterium]